MAISVDDSQAGVDLIGADNYLIDEDGSFLLTLDAQTPDRDGSENLTTLVIENLPAGWVPNTNGVVDPGLFEQGSAQISSATVSGDSLTITFVAGVQDFDGALRVTPLEHDDRDIATILGQDLVATVTSMDTADGLPSDTETASDSLDIDVDAIVDPLNVAPLNSTVDETTDGLRRIGLALSDIALVDNDGSETLRSLELTISVNTLSEGFDPSDTNDLLLELNDGALLGSIVITQIGATDDSVSYEITPADGVANAEFEAALEALRVVLPQHFSGVLTYDGTFTWDETTTGDVEVDTSDNFASSNIQFTHTVRPVAEAELTAQVFVLSDTDVADGSPTALSAEIKDGSITAANILTLLESTSDGSGPGQVELFVGLNATTPDLDGSEQLETIVLDNVPSDWIADYLVDGTVQQSAFFNISGSAALSQAEYDKVDTATYNATTGALTIQFVDDVTSFAGSLQLMPSLYEDYDVDREDGDMFTAIGQF